MGNSFSPYALLRYTVLSGNEYIDVTLLPLLGTRVSQIPMQ